MPPGGAIAPSPGLNLATLPYAAGVMAPTSSSHRPYRDALFDVHPQTGVTIEVFYADRIMETFGRCGAGGFGGLAGAASRRTVRRLGPSPRATQRIGTE